MHLDPLDVSPSRCGEESAATGGSTHECSRLINNREFA